jgi:ATP-dependent Zn protease
MIDEEVKELIAERYHYAQRLLSDHRKELERIAEALLEREVLNEEQLQQLVEGMQNYMDTVDVSQADSNNLVTQAVSRS